MSVSCVLFMVSFFTLASEVHESCRLSVPTPVKAWASWPPSGKEYQIWENFHINRCPGQEGCYSSSLPGKGCSAKFVRLEKIHTGETDVTNLWTTEKLYAELVPYRELTREVVGNKTVLLTGIMELLGFVFPMPFDAPSIAPSSCSNSLVTKLKGF